MTEDNIIKPEGSPYEYKKDGQGGIKRVEAMKPPVGEILAEGETIQDGDGNKATLLGGNAISLQNGDNNAAEAYADSTATQVGDENVVTALKAEGQIPKALQLGDNNKAFVYGGDVNVKGKNHYAEIAHGEIAQESEAGTVKVINSGVVGVTAVSKISQGKGDNTLLTEKLGEDGKLFDVTSIDSSGFDKAQINFAEGVRFKDVIDEAGVRRITAFANDGKELGKINLSGYEEVKVNGQVLKNESLGQIASPPAINSNSAGKPVIVDGPAAGIIGGKVYQPGELPPAALQPDSPLLPPR